MAKAPLTREVSVEEAKRGLDALIHEVQTTQIEIIVKQADKPVVRIVPPVSSREEARRRFAGTASSLRSAVADIPTHELEMMIDRAVAEVRAQRKGRARRG